MRKVVILILASTVYICLTEGSFAQFRYTAAIRPVPPVIPGGGLSPIERAIGKPWQTIITPGTRDTNSDIKDENSGG